ncbi:MAG TPA: hypothetical protein VG273_11675, partial [Bryobacteraceae bacterium]|nr:hypothetical protein [Bryobacteraceae bacterium]
KLPFLLFLLVAGTASAAIDGTVVNGTTGKPQPGATVTLFQTSDQGPQDLGSVKTDASGRFVIDKDVKPGQGGGPLLLQAVYGGVQYNKVIPPGFPMTGVSIPVFETSKTQGDAKIDQHMILLEPSPAGEMKVSETYVFKNDGKTTWNDPDRGTLQFALPPASQGKVEINVLAPGGMPIRRAPDPGTKPNTYKLDFPIKPGESQVEMTWTMPFTAPGSFEDQILVKGGLTRLVAPLGVTLKGTDLEVLGQEPSSQATVYNVKGPEIKVSVEGTGSLSGPGSDNSADNTAPGLSEILPKLYGLAAGSSNLGESLLAVKWILLTVIGMLALGFVLLYRKGDPELKTPDTKAPGHASGRG